MLIKSRLEALGVQAVTTLTFVSGIVTLFEPLARRVPLRLGLLAYQFHFIIIHRALSVVLGFALVYLSYQLAQRKLVAWWASATISAYLALSAIVFQGGEIAAVAATVTLGALLLSRPQFSARSEARSVRQGVLLLLLSMVFALVYGVIGFELLDQRDFGTDFNVGTAVSHTVDEYLLIGNTDLHPHTRYARGFLGSLDLFGIVSIGFGLYSLFRPLTYTLRVLPHERDEVSRLLRTYGDRSEGHLKLWPHDKSYLFEASRAVVAYQVRSGVALAVGAPVGAATAQPAVVERFSRMCQESGWDPAFILVPHSGLSLFNDTWRRLAVGEDAIVNLAHFTESVARNKHFRNIGNRFATQEITFKVHQPPHARSLLRELEVVSNAWLASGKQQWGFIQGRFEPSYLNEGPLYVVRNVKGAALAFASGIDPYVRGQTTIDLMRHYPDAPSNTMDFLLMKIMQYCHGAGYVTFNLGMAPLTSSQDAEPASPEERLLQLVARLNQNIIAVEGLRRFKSKFEPQWESQYLVYRGLPTNLVRIGLALARAAQVNA